MDHNEKFWVSVWGMVCSMVVIVGLMVIASIESTNAKVVEMVQAGANPIVAACAISAPSTSGNAIICAQAALSHGTTPHHTTQG